MTPFPESTTTFEKMFGKGTFALNLVNSDLLDFAKVKKWFRQPDEVIGKDVPHPTNDDGEKLPHGAELDFERIPIRYLS